MKKQKKPWPLGRVIEVFLLVFGALTVAVPMGIAIRRIASERTHFSGAICKMPG